MKSSKLKTKLDITFCVLFYEKIEGTNDCYLLTDDEYFLAQVVASPFPSQQTIANTSCYLQIVYLCLICIRHVSVSRQRHMNKQEVIQYLSK